MLVNQATKPIRCLVPRPHYCARPKHFGSRGLSKFLSVGYFTERVKIISIFDFYLLSFTALKVELYWNGVLEHAHVLSVRAFNHFIWIMSYNEHSHLTGKNFHMSGNKKYLEECNHHTNTMVEIKSVQRICCIFFFLSQVIFSFR